MDDKKENNFNKHQEEALKLHMETIFILKEKSLIYIKENKLQLALKVLEQALNMAEELFHAGIKELFEDIREINEGIRILHLKIKRNNKNKVSIRTNNENYFLSNLNEALIEIEEHPTEEIDDGNFIIFENYRDECIQFVRLINDNWGIDIPITSDGEFYYSLQEQNLSTFQVKMIVFNFIKGNFPIVKLSNIKNLDLQKHEFKNIINSIPSELTCQYCGNNIKIDQKKCNFCGIENNFLLNFLIKED